MDASDRAQLREMNELTLLRLDTQFAQRCAELERQLARVEHDIALGRIHDDSRRERRRNDRWMTAAWLSLMIPLIGLWFRR